MSACRKHFFSALSAHFGPHGDFDENNIHYHPCINEGCDRVVLGPGRTCDGDKATHRRATLGKHDAIAREVSAVVHPQTESRESA